MVLAKWTLPRGEVLELACGTGLWTRHLAQWHSRVVAIDASPEVIAINRQRVQSDLVDYVVADVFTWQPNARFDASLKDGGRVFFADSLLEQSSTARDHEQLNRSGFATRWA